MGQQDVADVDQIIEILIENGSHLQRRALRGQCGVQFDFLCNDSMQMLGLLNVQHRQQARQKHKGYAHLPEGAALISG
uniref:Uncharacterized protein n=1 Tax=mine drainage metagenome TaxID=410659 RepID=E6QJH4_9ZZZZ